MNFVMFKIKTCRNTFSNHNFSTYDATILIKFNTVSHFVSVSQSITLSRCFYHYNSEFAKILERLLCKGNCKKCKMQKDSRLTGRVCVCVRANSYRYCVNFRKR